MSGTIFGDLVGTPTPSQASWKNVGAKAGSGPPARSGAGMAYDARDGYSVLFGGGGCQANKPCSDTWSFKGGKWRDLKPARAPSPRVQPSMVYDPADGYVLLFGGSTTAGAGKAGTTYGDTWMFRGEKWTALKTSPIPPARTAGAMAYNPSTKSVILFGGYRNGRYLNDTWAFTGGRWTQLHPAVSPVGRAGASMVYDAADGYLVLFGGTRNYASSSGGLAETWRFLNGNWTELHPASSPDTLYGSGFVYDPSLAGAVLFGGWDPSSRNGGCGGVQGTTWEFKGGAWTELGLTLSPSARSGPAVDFDASADKLLLFGGASGNCTVPGGSDRDTWELGMPSNAASVREEFGLP